MIFIIRLSDSSCLKPLCESNNKATTTLSIKRLIKLKLSIVHRFFQARLKLIIVIGQGNTEIVQNMQVVQSAAKTYW